MIPQPTNSYNKIRQGGAKHSSRRLAAARGGWKSFQWLEALYDGCSFGSLTNLNSPVAEALEATHYLPIAIGPPNI